MIIGIRNQVGATLGYIVRMIAAQRSILLVGKVFMASIGLIAGSNYYSLYRMILFGNFPALSKYRRYWW